MARPFFFGPCYNFRMGLLRSRFLALLSFIFILQILVAPLSAFGGSPRTWHRNNRRIGVMYWGGFYPTGITDIYTPKFHYGTYHIYKLAVNLGDRWRVHGGTGTTEIKEVGHPRTLGATFLFAGWNFTPFLGAEWWQIKIPGSRGGDSFMSVGGGFEYTARWGWNLGVGGFYKKAAAGLFLQAGFFFCTAWASVKCKSSLFF